MVCSKYASDTNSFTRMCPESIIFLLLMTCVSMVRPYLRQINVSKYPIRLLFCTANKILIQKVLNKKLSIMDGSQLNDDINDCTKNF